MVDINAILQTAVEAAVSKLLEPIRHDVNTLDGAMSALSRFVGGLPQASATPAQDLSGLILRIEKLERTVALLTDGYIKPGEESLAVSDPLYLTIKTIADHSANMAIDGHFELYDHSEFLTDQSHHEVRQMVEAEVKDIVASEFNDFRNGDEFNDAVIDAVESASFRLSRG